MTKNIERFLRHEQKRKSQGTYKARKTDLKQFLGWLDDEDLPDPIELGWQDIDDYVLEMVEEEYAESTVSHRLLSIRLFYDYLVKRDVIEDNPAEEVDLDEFAGLNGSGQERELKEKVSYISPEEKELLCENVPKPTLRNELIARLMFQTGVRVHELVNIRVDDIEREERSIRIWSEKTTDARTVYYQPSLDFLLDQWLDGGYRDSNVTAEDSPYLFLTYRSEKMLIQTVNEIVKKAAENAGIQEVLYTDASGQDRYQITAHTLRHSFAVQCIKNNMPTRMLQELMGHSELSTTERYLRVVEEDVRDAAQRYGAGTEEVEP